LLATNDGVVGPLVEDGVAAFGADNEVVGRRRVEINLGKARGAINRETFDVVVNHSVEGSAPQTDSIGSQDAIGGTINEIVNEGGWRLLFKHPFGIGM